MGLCGLWTGVREFAAVVTDLATCGPAERNRSSAATTKHRDNGRCWQRARRGAREDGNAFRRCKLSINTTTIDSARHTGHPRGFPFQYDHERAQPPLRLDIDTEEYNLYTTFT